MNDRAGLSPDVSLKDALLGAEILPPTMPLSVTILQALRRWNETQAAQRQPGVGNVASLAVLLEASLISEGWSFADLEDGSVRAFVSSEIDELCELIDDLEGEPTPARQ